MPPLPLIQYAQQCEDAASGLHRFSAGLPRTASRIATIFGEFFALSAVIRNIHAHEDNRNYESSFYQARDELEVGLRSLGLTLDDTFDFFVKIENRPEQIVWDDFNSRLEMEGCLPLVARMKIYNTFFNAQLRTLERQETVTLEPLRRSLSMLLEAQERARLRSTPDLPWLRRSTGPPLYTVDTPLSPSVYSDEWDTEYLNRCRVPAPEPPLPLSPTYTSGSSQDVASSQTSYSGGMHFSSPPPVPSHWSLRVFDGRHPTTVYQPAYRSSERSACFGNLEPEALRNLSHDGFLPALQVGFDEGSLTARFYWRPSDHRARILVAAKDPSGNLLFYCQPLTNLKMIRSKSCLQLCRARRDDDRYTLWARLNFYFHERMVLFYSTFSAMKRQDRSGSTHQQLTDRFELETEDGEECQFSGQTKHDGMLHAIRVFRDRGSGVVRLEATALRGSKKDVALWTAFITKYAIDPDWAAFERGSVSLAAFRPPPYVFVAQYEPPRDRYNHYVLLFTTDNGTWSRESFDPICTNVDQEVLDALMFTQTWAQICSSYGRIL